MIKDFLFLLFFFSYFFFFFSLSLVLASKWEDVIRERLGSRKGLEGHCLGIIWMRSCGF